MGRLLAVLGALIGLLLVPLALTAPTAAMLVPAHLVFAVLAAAGAVVEGYAGRPGRARLWGLGYLAATLAMVGAFELGGRVRDSWYWMLPWAAMLVWGWVPPLLSGVFGWVGEQRRRRLIARTVRRRRKKLAEQ